MTKAIEKIMQDVSEYDRKVCMNHQCLTCPAKNDIMNCTATNMLQYCMEHIDEVKSAWQADIPRDYDPVRRAYDLLVVARDHAATNEIYESLVEEAIGILWKNLENNK